MGKVNNGFLGQLTRKNEKFKFIRRIHRKHCITGQRLSPQTKVADANSASGTSGRPDLGGN